MTAPLIWIIFPGVVSIILFGLLRWRRLTGVIGVFVCLALGGLAWVLPVQKIIDLGPWTFQVGDTWMILGRRFILGNQDRSIITMIYLISSFWFGAANLSNAGRFFVPMGLGIISLLTAALAVEPFLYAALLIEIAVLISVPILLPPGKQANKGILRYITFLTLGIPFILFTEWMVAGVETTPGDATLVLRAAVLLGFGFAFLLAVTPFHTWIVMLAEESNPYAVSFVVTVLPWMITLFGLGFLDRYTWLRTSEVVHLILRLAGLLMALTGGIGIVFQRQLGRIFGFAVLGDMGFSLMALGLPPGGYLLFFGMFLPKTISFGVWALSLSTLKTQAVDLNYKSLVGLGRKMPIASGALLLSHLTIAGFPLLAGFPTRLALLRETAYVSNWQATLALLAGVGMLVSGLRTLSVLVTGSEDDDWKVTESWQNVVMLSVGILALILIGIFPQVFLPPFLNGLQSFPHLAP